MPQVRRTGTGGLLQHQAASRSRAETYSGSGCDPRRGHRCRTSHFVANISLTYNILLPILPPRKRKFLVRQAKLGESSWLRSQPDKVSRPSEPNFVFIRVIV